MPMVDVSRFYFNKDSMHAKNERAYRAIDHLFILDHL